MLPGKSSKAFRTIGEMAEELGVKSHILRYWEEQFPMLRPLKRAGGRRHYRADDAALLREIYRLLNAEGYSIKGARNFLNNNGRANISGADHGLVADAHSPQDTAPPSANNGWVPVGALAMIRQRLLSALD